MADENPPPGTFVLHSHAVPPLPAGTYRVHADQKVSAPGATTQSMDADLEVTAPRFSLPADQVLSTFPPNQGQGAFSSRLPQIVLKRRTLPWERELDGDPAQTSALPRDVPWLALVVLADAEAELRTARPIAECVTPGVVLGGRNDATVGDCIVVTERVVRQVFPAKDELPLLSHVRRVDLSDTELALGDDDGWMAVVLANRLPQPGVRYQACLVSLEGQYDALPDPVPPVPGYSGTYVYAEQAVAYDTISASYARSIDRSGGAGGPGVQAAGHSAGHSAAQALSTGAGAAPGARSLSPADGWSARTATGPAGAAARTGAVVTSTAQLIGDMHVVPIGIIDPGARQLTFPVLAHWQFICTGAGDFQSLMQGLDVGMLGTPPRPAPVPQPGEKPPPPPARPPAEVLDTGHVALTHTSREGETATVWYRGPLTPRPTGREQPDPDTGRLPLAHSSDQVRRVGPDGRENLSLATAFDIGRLLALAEPSVVAALLSWRKDALERARTAALLAREPSLGRLVDGAVVTALGSAAGRGLLTTLGADAARRLGPARPLTDPARPAKGVDDADPLEVLSSGLGVDVAALRGLLEPAAAQRVPVDVPVAGVLADPFKLAAAAARELAPLRATAARVATDLANQALAGSGAAPPGHAPPTDTPGAAPCGAPEAVQDAAPHPPGAEPDALDELLARLNRQHPGGQ
ncbi:MAG TPA: hypothetical protein VFV73_04215 [Streptosporangiaceae bacterium]|nr:hypothetical protein [Streptosporangiaceae bacterium]